MKQKSTKEFARLIRDITHSEDYRVMKERRHHVKGSVYDHSVKVAYLCYRHYQRFGTKIALSEFIRGALLHDYYLYDRNDKTASPRFHGFVHPGYALGNAKQRYPDLTRIERDMILRHMFPLTPIPPRTKAGWLICFYDKVAAVSDYFGKDKWKKRASLRRKAASAAVPAIPQLPAPSSRTTPLHLKPHYKGM